MGQVVVSGANSFSNGSIVLLGLRDFGFSRGVIYGDAEFVCNGIHVGFEFTVTIDEFNHKFGMIAHSENVIHGRVQFFGSSVIQINKRLESDVAVNAGEHWKSTGKHDVNVQS